MNTGLDILAKSVDQCLEVKDPIVQYFGGYDWGIGFFRGEDGTEGVDTGGQIVGVCVEGVGVIRASGGFKSGGE